MSVTDPRSLVLIAAAGWLGERESEPPNERVQALIERYWEAWKIPDDDRRHDKNKDGEHDWDWCAIWSLHLVREVGRSGVPWFGSVSGQLKPWARRHGRLIHLASAQPGDLVVNDRHVGLLVRVVDPVKGECVTMDGNHNDRVEYAQDRHWTMAIRWSD